MWLHITIFCYTSGDSTDTLGLSSEGITGCVLLILAGVMSVMVWVLGITFAAVWLCFGKHIPVDLVVW